MDYKKKYLKYKNKYLLAKNILKTGGGNISYPSIEEKQKQKNSVIERLEESLLKQIDDCNKNTEMKKSFCNFYKGDNYTNCNKRLKNFKNDCIKKAQDEYIQFTRSKVKKPVNIKEEKVLKDIINNHVYESRKNKAIEEIKTNPSLSPATKQFLIENI